MRRWMTAAGLVMALSVVACDSEEPSSEAGDGDDTQTLRWSLDGLEDLGPQAVYEGWIIVDGAPVSTGRFSIDAARAPSVDAFEVDAEQAKAATAFVLTIEPAQGDDPGPSDSKLMAGGFAESMAALEISDASALGTDFTDASGEFLLQTPTSEEPSDYSLGIWFLNPGSGAATLELPELPAGWVYEGWIVGDDGPLSTGRFATPREADSDGKGPAAGPLGAPGKPGQDFIDPALDLVSLTAVVTVEPEPDNDPAPFVLKPLVTATIADVPPPDLQALDNNAAATNPSGAAWFE